MTKQAENNPQGTANIADDRVLGTGIFCPDCDTEMEQIDTTHSNINTSRCQNGQHTGNIYKCETCECSWLENFLNTSKLERWAG